MTIDQEESSYDYVFKLIVVGDSGVGKTNLLGRFAHDTFDFASKSTIGLDLTVKNMDIKGKRVRAQIWDTAGQERYRSITKRYYRGAVGALLVYDITKRESFESLGRWLNELKINEAHPDSMVMLVGNKSDLEPQREVSQEEALNYSKINGIMFMETSALESTNVQKAFESLIHTIFDKLSGKLATMDDKKAKIMRGQAIQISAPLNSETKNKHNNSCAC
ncbi:P-loop containing nucleoside triphosphate hydrolase protein [Parasitella parasitica]|nr:P-loop containing nucleoside triphosphate hydrolase protein [Parasitella parasitica]